MGVAGAAHLGLFGVLIPLAVVRNRQKLRDGRKLPPRSQFFTSVIVEQLFFLFVSLVVAKLEWIPIFALPKLTPVTLGLTAALVALHAGVGTYRARQRVRRRDPKLWSITPRTGTERVQWAGISFAAGIGEEITYRAVFVTLVARLSGSYPVAAAITAVVFGVAHATQGWTVAAIVTGYAVGWHLLVWTSGSILLPVIVHIAHDLWIGLYLGHLTEREGWDPQVPAAG